MIKYLIIYRYSHEDEAAFYDAEYAHIVKGFHSREAAEKHIKDTKLPVSGEKYCEVVEIEFEDENQTE